MYIQGSRKGNGNAEAEIVAVCSLRDTVRERERERALEKQERDLYIQWMESYNVLITSEIYIFLSNCLVTKQTSQQPYHN